MTNSACGHTPYEAGLMTLLWELDGGGSYVDDNGSRVEVLSTGEYDQSSGRFSGASIKVGDGHLRGDVIVAGAESIVRDGLRNVVLRLTLRPCSAALRDDGTVLSTLVLKPTPLFEAAYEALREGCGKQRCAGFISRMDPYARITCFTRLLFDRLERKCGEITSIYSECGSNWNETAYRMLMRTMGDRVNKEAFTELSRRVKYGFISRERDNIRYVEAMLLGASGLLDYYGEDEYVRALREDYEHLRRKYSITSMLARSWTVAGIRSHNQPALRMAQLATLLCSRDFLFDKIINCEKVEDFHELLRCGTSDYWEEHFVPGRNTQRKSKNLGYFKANILGINLVVPMTFAYAAHLGDEDMKIRAVNLLEKIGCEENNIIDSWRRGGVPMESAFDSQAVLELNNEFCGAGACIRCRVGKQLMRGVLAGNG